MKLLTEQRLRKLANELYDVIDRIDGVYSTVYRSFDSHCPSLDLDVAKACCRSAANYMRGIRPPETPKLKRMQAREARNGNG